MANYGNPNQEYWAQQDPYAQPQPQQHQQHQSYNFDMPEQFGQELYVLETIKLNHKNYIKIMLFKSTIRNYTPFEANQPANANENNSFYDPNAQYSGGMFTPADAGKYYNDGGEGNEFDNEPPLLEGW